MLIDPQRMVLHVGVPKTGTTTLQLRLFAEHPEITYLGKPYDRPGVDEATNTAISQLVDAVWTRTSFEYDPDAARSLLARGMQGRVDDHASGPVVLSEEALTQASGADRLLKAKRLRRLFGHCRVLITIREQLAALRSGHR